MQMSDLTTQINNCESLLKFLDQIIPSSFNGGMFSKRDVTAGCAIHWAYKSRKLTLGVLSAISNSRETGGGVISEPEVIAAFEESYGQGSPDLFDNIACHCGKDINEFRTCLKEHIQDLRNRRRTKSWEEPEVKVPWNSSFVVRYNDVQYLFTDRKVMDAELAILKKFRPDANPKIFEYQLVEVK
jgi:hypothetical protein